MTSLCGTNLCTNVCTKLPDEMSYSMFLLSNVLPLICELLWPAVQVDNISIIGWVCYSYKTVYENYIKGKPFYIRIIIRSWKSAEKFYLSSIRFRLLLTEKCFSFIETSLAIWLFMFYFILFFSDTIVFFVTN